MPIPSANTKARSGISTAISVFILIALLTGLLAAAWAYKTLVDSHPLLEGSIELPGLQGAVKIERDIQGIPTVRAQSRIDISFALGFLHAQERMFQMDLYRRSAAGELAELLGSKAINYDTRIRRHRFRWRSEQNFAALKQSDKALLQAYANGVNSGIQQLKKRPFEYLLLGAGEISPWKPEETLLVTAAMTLDLQDEAAGLERSLGAMKDILPSDWYHFLKPSYGQWDAPIDAQETASELSLPHTKLTQLLSQLSSLPKREGFDGSLPSDWSDGSHKWSGYVPFEEHPRQVHHQQGRIWTAGNKSYWRN